MTNTVTLEKAIEAKGYTIEGLDQIQCPGLVFTILKSLEQLAIVGPDPGLTYEGECGGQLNGEFGCSVTYNITGSSGDKVLRVQASTNSCATN